MGFHPGCTEITPEPRLSLSVQLGELLCFLKMWKIPFSKLEEPICGPGEIHLLTAIHCVSCVCHLSYPHGACKSGLFT